MLVWGAAAAMVAWNWSGVMSWFPNIAARGVENWFGVGPSDRDADETGGRSEYPGENMEAPTGTFSGAGAGAAGAGAGMSRGPRDASSLSYAFIRRPHA
jgi:hypothetical protein